MTFAKLFIVVVACVAAAVAAKQEAAKDLDTSAGHLVPVKAHGLGYGGLGYGGLGYGGYGHGGYIGDVYGHGYGYHYAPFSYGYKGPLSYVNVAVKGPHAEFSNYGFKAGYKLY